MIRKTRGRRIRKIVKEKVEERDYKVVKEAISKMPVLRRLVILLLKPEVLRPKEFYDRLSRDLIDAKDEVFIYSPFTLRPKVMEILAFIKRSEAPVTVYTKPVDDFDNDTSRKWQRINIGELEKAGVKVETRKGMHEKAVLIGDRIAYFGSLNVLSRWKEEEGGDYMLRYESPLVSSLIEDFLMETFAKVENQ